MSEVSQRIMFLKQRCTLKHPMRTNPALVVLFSNMHVLTLSEIQALSRASAADFFCQYYSKS